MVKLNNRRKDEDGTEVKYKAYDNKCNNFLKSAAYLADGGQILK